MFCGCVKDGRKWATHPLPVNATTDNVACTSQTQKKKKSTGTPINAGYVNSSASLEPIGKLLPPHSATKLGFRLRAVRVSGHVLDTLRVDCC